MEENLKNVDTPFEHKGLANYEKFIAENKYKNPGIDSLASIFSLNVNLG